MAKTIEDVRSAGYEVAFASGSVAVEEEALAAKQALAAPEAVQRDVEQIATATAQAVAKDPTLNDQQRADIVVNAASRALTSITKARDSVVSYHERALAAAQEMPDVYFVSALGDPDTPDDDIQLYVACKADGTGWDEGAQATLDSLAAPQ